MAYVGIEAYSKGFGGSIWTPSSPNLTLRVGTPTSEAHLAILSPDTGQICGSLAGGIGGYWLRRGCVVLLSFIFGLIPVALYDGRHASYSGSHAPSTPSTT